MKSKLLIMILCFTAVSSLLISSTKSIRFSSLPPEGYTGATGAYCNSCHADYALNIAGGSVVLTGLPTGNYIPNTTYNLALKINHFTSDRTRWGFAIKAVNTAGITVGTFSTSNANAYINGDELSHFYAITTNAQSSFIYDSLKWTAPATPGNATFYYVGNAANNSSGNDGDYIYAGVSTIALPIILKDFTAKVIDEKVSLSWETTANNRFDFFNIERSDDGQFYFSIGKVNTNTNAGIYHYNIIDDKVSFNNRSNIYYRLKSIDKNGEINYSKTVSVQIKNTALVIKNVYPTIVKQNNNVTVEMFSSNNDRLKISVIDALGNILMQYDFMIRKGINKIQLPITTNCSTGVKFLRFATPNFVETKTIIVAK